MSNLGSHTILSCGSCWKVYCCFPFCTLLLGDTWRMLSKNNMLDHVLPCQPNQLSIRPSLHQICFQMMEMKVIFRKVTPARFILQPWLSKNRRYQNEQSLLSCSLLFVRHRCGIPAFFLVGSHFFVVSSFLLVQSQILLLKSQFLWSDTQVWGLKEALPTWLLVELPFSSWFLIFKLDQITFPIKKNGHM